jgi:hypothetical protein
MLDDTIVQKVTIGGQVLRRKISIHESYEAALFSALLLKLKQYGLDISTFGPMEQQRYFLVRSGTAARSWKCIPALKCWPKCVHLGGAG